MKLSEVLEGKPPEEAVDLPHGKLHPLLPGQMKGVWRTLSGRIIHTEHMVMTLTDDGFVAQECFTWFAGAPWLYCREVEE